MGMGMGFGMGIETGMGFGMGMGMGMDTKKPDECFKLTGFFRAIAIAYFDCSEFVPATTQSVTPL